MGPKTRNSSKPYKTLDFNPCILPESQLPTNRDVYQHFLHVRNELNVRCGDLRQKIRTLSSLVMQDILKVWERSNTVLWEPKKDVNSNPASGSEPGSLVWERSNIIAERTILQKIEKLHTDAIKLQRWGSRRGRIFEIINARFNELFDILHCRCDLSDAPCRSCPPDKKVPKLEVSFIKDQRTKRKMFLSGYVDKAGTSKLLEKQCKKILEAKREIQGQEKCGADTSACATSSPDPDSLEDQSSSSEPGASSESLDTDDERSERNYRQLPNYSRMCDRYGVTDRAAAALLNAALMDYGIVNGDKTKDLVDRNKIRRQRELWGKKEANSYEMQDVLGVFYDGREDMTLQKNGKTKKELHDVIVTEPGCKYMDHITPTSGKAPHIAEGLLDVLDEYEIEPQVVGCDGTAVNTGHIGGVNRRLENALERPLQQVVCGIHANELPLRHVFQDADGKSSGPSSFKGAIGRELEKDLCSLPLADFETVPGMVQEIPVEVQKHMSRDQKYLYRMSMAVQQGKASFPQDLLTKQPGPLHQARWLTLANRILRLYVSEHTPSLELKRLVFFVLNQYAPGWFRFKTHWKITDGAPNFMYLILLSRRLPDIDRQITQTVLQRNAYWAHSENILIAMLADEHEDTRKMAVQTILRCRLSSMHSPKQVRQFLVPKVNFESEAYHQLIDWRNTVVTEPPLSFSISSAELEQVVSKPLEVPDIPCHSQGVERWVSEVTRASGKVSGHERRHRMILTRTRSVKELPETDTKRSFVEWANEASRK